ncbi:helix-turn-helix transcriptional regulator [Sphingobium sp. EM0848]|uniref:helix-turn-helix domain-containing protein n=1 Tax=Sphingobium sp. EM0848 TaxID=2743473 RepID=UPI00159C6109|nr:helix-turn-helix transcriptional regulator [Sphingobium sp. EM0848]
MISSSSSSDPFGAEHEALLATLRRRLRAAGWTQADVAVKLGVGTATVKRWLHGKGISLRTLSQLCALANTTLTELAECCAIESRPDDHLTLAQEKALTASPELSTVFFVIVNGWPVSEAEEGFGIPPEQIVQYVERLERLALIDRLPGGRLRARLDPAHVWRREPMRRHFEKHMKHLFFKLDYGDPATIFGVETVKLSPVGVARVAERIERFRGELRDIAQEDRRTTVLPSEWHAILAVACPTLPLRS